MKTITAEELKTKLDNKEDFILVNTLPKQYFDIKHIPGSVNIPLAELEERSKTKLADKNKSIVVYCANKSCDVSVRATNKLAELGYTNVADFEDGVQGWEDAGFTLEGTEA